MFEYCPVLAEMVLTRRAVGKSGRVFDGLAALSTVNNLRVIHQLMHEMAASRTLEIGLSFGGSALAFCAAHKELGHAPEGQHTALDPFQTTVWDSCGLMALERAGLTDYIDFRLGYSSLELPKLLEARAQFDLVYVDGSHLFEDVFVDAYFAIRVLGQGGVIAFDDSTNPHIAKLLGFLRTSIRGGLEEIDLSQYGRERSHLIYRFARYFRRVQLTPFRRVGSVERVWDAAFLPF
jgi:hypothetical protein